MSEAPKQIDLIESIAIDYGVLLDDNNFECACFVYAHVIHLSVEILKNINVSKSSFMEMECALDVIHYKINVFKVSGIIDEDSKIYSDIEFISPTLEIVVSQLRTIITIYDDTLPDPRRRPEKLRLRGEALKMLNEGLLACRRYLTEIESYVNWWGNEVQIKSCQKFRSTG